MMFKTNKVLCVVSILLIVVCLLLSNKVEAKEQKIAVLYDTYNEFGENENKLNDLVTLILSSGNALDLINVSLYSNNESNKYNKLIVLYNNSSNVSENLTEDLLSFKGDILWVGKNFNKAVKKEKIQYMPYFSSKDSNYSVLKKEIYKFINDKEEEEKKIYILIDKIYPFIDLNEFIKKIDFLNERGISFICSVMPVYENEDFEAMKRFCEVLRYAQSKGGKVILHSSVLFGEDIQGKDVKKKMDLAQQIYIRQGVYPLALDIPEGFLYKADYKELISLSSTVFLEKEKKLEIINSKNYSINKFNRIINKVQVKEMQEAATLYRDTAISFDSDLDFKNFSSQVEHILNKEIYFNDVDYLDTVIKLGLVELSCRGTNILLNNKSVHDVENTPNPQEQTVGSVKNKKQSIDISNTNRNILNVTFLVCIIFIIIVFISRKVDMRKYFNK